MVRRAPAEDKQARAAKETAEHGGLVALLGGPWNGFWFWRDDVIRQREVPRFAGYVETGEQVENRSIKDPNGIDLRWYGLGAVWQFDPSLGPPKATSAQVNPIPLAYCACGECLLLPGRDTCERCRLGVSPDSCLIWRPHGEVPAEEPEWTAEPLANPVLDSGDLIEPQPDPEPAPVAQPQDSTLPPPDPAEVADFVWRNVAYLYDR